MGIALGRLARSLASVSTVLAFAMALAGSAGAAASLNGTYEGKLSCKGLAAGAASKSKQDVTIRVSESKLGIAMNIAAGATPIGDPLRGFVMDDSGKPDRAKLFAVDCDMNLVSLSNLTMIGDAVAKEGSDKATLKGALTDTTDRTRILDCTFSVKRTSTAPVKIEVCVLE